MFAKYKVTFCKIDFWSLYSFRTHVTQRNTAITEFFALKTSLGYKTDHNNNRIRYNSFLVI